MRMFEKLNDDSGVALITALMAVLMFAAAGALLVTIAVNQQQQSEFQEREDIVIAGSEAILERYAAKLTVDPLYYLHRVDEAERARVCTDAGSSIWTQVREPGQDWEEDCTSWDYQNPDLNGDSMPDATPGWYTHPLLEGNNVVAGVDLDDVAVRMEVIPPSGSQDLTVVVAGKRGERVNRRSIQASISATSLSEFFRVTQLNLTYGANADIEGKIYAGGTLNFNCCATGNVHADAFSEGGIGNPPNFLDGSQGFDNSGSYNDIRTVFENPLNFDNFWTDLDVIVSAACQGDGICLDDPGTTAWLVHPHVVAGDGKLAIWRSTDNRTNGCIDAEEYWWRYAMNPTGPDTFADMWSGPTIVDMPANGTLWANAHVVVGNRNWGAAQDYDSDGRGDSVLKGSLTLYAGTAGNPRNVILYSDTWYDGQDLVTRAIPSFDTLGLIASDEIVINHDVAGGDGDFYINASLLGQTDKWRVTRSCGTGGSQITPGSPTLYARGSIATRTTGDIGAHFSPRFYGFDNRLEYLRPPLFPLLEDDWRYEDWKELPLEDWMKD